MTIENIRSSLVRLPARRRTRLLKLCEQIFGATPSRKDEVSRVVAAKVMVALLPDSAPAIARWLRIKSGRYIHEVHFSLFCFLDDVQHMSGVGDYVQQALSLVEEFLHVVKSDAAHAAFMAGDLLGEHWETQTAMPVLLRLAKTARYAAGRKAVVHGLGHMLTRIPAGTDGTQKIAARLKDLAEKDRSEQVRLEATMTLAGKLA
jgi:hypothetical protein